MPKPQANDDGRTMAGYYMSLMEGDTHQIESAMEFMKSRGWLDEDGEFINDEDE
jgi:hypothetical protein